MRGHYVIATWSDGMKLVRPVDLDGPMMMKILADNIKTEAHAGFKRIAQEGTSALIALMDPSGRTVVSLEINPTLLGLPGADDWIVRRMGTPGFVMMSAEQRDAVVWITRKVIGEPLSVLENLPSFPIPDYWGHTGDSAFSRSLEMDARTEHAPAAGRASLWVGSTLEVVRELDEAAQIRRTARGGDGHRITYYGPKNEQLKTLWAGLMLYARNFQVTVNFPTTMEIKAGVRPVWNIHDDSWHSTRFESPLLATSTVGIYDVLKKAGVAVKTDEYEDWVTAHSLPGTLTDDLELFSMLGLPSPVVGPHIDFVAWLAAGKESL